MTSKYYFTGDKMIESVSMKPRINAIKAIDKICNRCLGDNLKINYNGAMYCEDCYHYQTITSNHFLIRRARIKQKKKHKLVFNLNLSKAQLIGENFIYNCYKQNETGFLHAVCGAGKTEMCVKTIYHALSQQLSICFIIPRVEIIKQVFKRFKAYFPKTNICCLYQNQYFDEHADIYISTPHQLIKFYKEFDLLMIDEVDAYPFANNQFLKRLIKKASKDISTIILISATLCETEKMRIQDKQIKYLLIPNRFHNHDLIIPKFIKYQKPRSLYVIKYIKSYLLKNKQLMVFVPSIAFMKQFFQYLKTQNIDSLSISSQSKYKNLILKSFKNKSYHILLTTTLLERGVTFKKINVFVLEADNKIFSKEVLIQISGRVGRDKDYPQGDLCFFSRYKTAAMRDAKKALKKMNKEKFNEV